MQSGLPLLDAAFQAQSNVRIQRALERFLAHRSGVALAGSLAMFAQLKASGRVLADRVFVDIDFVTISLNGLPGTIADEFLCPHVHADAGVGRTLVQFVHPSDAVRIDVFAASEGSLSRATPFRFGDTTVPVVSLEDQAARAASLCMKLVRGGPVAAKHARDLKLMLPSVSNSDIDIVWDEHRHPSDPSCFQDAVKLIQDHAEAHLELLVTPEFSSDLSSICPKWAKAGAFHPAPAAQIFSILGYV